MTGRRSEHSAVRGSSAVVVALVTTTSSRNQVRSPTKLIANLKANAHRGLEKHRWRVL
ncbi:hypothetical protein L4J96_003933 [Proteus mirabilis]